MKRATLHLVCDNEPVDFEIHDDGKIVVPDYDLETDMAAVELGFKPSECLKLFDHLHDGMLGILKDHKVLTPLLQYSWALLRVSTAHMSEADNDLLEESVCDNEARSELWAHQLYFRPTKTGWYFELSLMDSPVELVEEAPVRRADPSTPRISDGLLELLQAAWEEGIIDIEFSNDAIEIPGFKVYEW